MNYYFYHSDPSYTDAFRHYYNTFKSRDFMISFHGGPKENDVVICQEKHMLQFENKKKIIFSDTNNTSKNKIKAFQIMDDFYTCLLEQEFNRLEKKIPRVYFFTNAFGGSGSTTLSLNFAQMLSEFDQVFYMSLDILSTYKYYLPQDQKFGFSEIIYKLKSKTSLNLESHKNLDYFNVCDYLEDMMLFNKELFAVLIDNIINAGYKKIVVDVGRRYEFLDLKDGIIFTVLQASVFHYENISALNSLFNTQVYLINKRKLDKYICESHLKHIHNYEYINYELDFEGGGFQWSSKAIQKILKDRFGQI